MAHAQEQYKREAEWSAEEETCSGGSNERGAENSEPPITLQGFADALASLTVKVQRIVDERRAKNSEPPTKEDK